EIEVKIAVFTSEQMKKAKSSRGAAAADVFSLLSDQPWNTLRTRISEQIITVINPAILKLDDYNITFTIPRQVSDPMRLVDGTNYQYLLKKALEIKKNPNARVLIEPKLVRSSHLYSVLP
ncbi:hypothetical protein R3P38DRAFT_2382470, partial [Favolaschia claudopus]